MIPRRLRNSNFVAIYWDFDDIYTNLQDSPQEKSDQHHTACNALTSPPEPITEQSVDTSVIIKYAKSIGAIRINRAYANWTRYSRSQILLLASSIELIQHFHGSTLASTLIQTRRALDALEDIQRQPEISHVILVGGNDISTELCHKLHRYGIQVIGIGARHTSTTLWKQACDEYKYLDVLFPKPVQMHIEDATMPQREANPNELQDLLLGAIASLMPVHPNGFVPKSLIKSTMQQLNPAFIETTYGFSSFDAIIEAFKDMLLFQPGESDQLIKVREIEETTTQPVPHKESGNATLADILQALRQINYRMIPPRLRLSAMQIVFDLFQQHNGINNFKLLEEMISEQFAARGETLQDADAKKIREMLYKARGFRFQMPEGILFLNDGIYSPQDLLYRIDLSIIQRLKDKYPGTLNPEAITEILYGACPDKLEYIKTLIETA